MEVIINQKTFRLQHHTISEALQVYGITQTKGIAIAINNTVIPKAEWCAITLQENDQITIITAAQGG